MRTTGKVTKIYPKSNPAGKVWWNFYLEGQDGMISTFDAAIANAAGKDISCELKETEKNGNTYTNASKIEVLDEESEDFDPEDDYAVPGATEIPMKEMDSLRPAKMPEFTPGKTSLPANAGQVSTWEANRDFHIRVGMACKQALDYLSNSTKAWDISNSMENSKYIDIVKKFYFLNEQAEKELIKDLASGAFK